MPKKAQSQNIKGWKHIMSADHCNINWIWTKLVLISVNHKLTTIEEDFDLKNNKFLRSRDMLKRSMVKIKEWRQNYIMSSVHCKTSIGFGAKPVLRSYAHKLTTVQEDFP